MDYITFLAFLGNHVAKVFSESVFCVFENVTAKKFAQGRFHGILRDLRGNSQTFIHVLEYEGQKAFSDADVFIVHPHTGTALNLSPLYFWGLNAVNQNEELDLYEFDTATKGSFSYKAVQLREAKIISDQGDLSEIWRTLSAMRNGDPPVDIFEGLSFGTDSTVSS
jgi:hypothetical protein